MFGVVGQTWDDVKHLVHDAVKWVADALNDGLDLIDYVYHTVTDALSYSLGVAWNVLNGIWRWVESAGATIGEWITSAISWWWDNIIVPTFDFLRGALNWAVDALQWAINSVVQSLDWVVRNLVSPALDWIWHAFDTVGHWIWDAIDGFYHAAIEPLLHDVESLFRELAQIADFVWHGLLDIYHAVVKAWDWIIWFGEHSFGELRALFSEVDHALNREWLLGAAHAENGAADEVARWLEELLR